jgi:hypothetical protein
VCVRARARVCASVWHDTFHYVSVHDRGSIFVVGLGLSILVTFCKRLSWAGSTAGASSRVITAASALKHVHGVSGRACSVLSAAYDHVVSAHTFYGKRTRSMVREHILRTVKDKKNSLHAVTYVQRTIM